MSMVFNNDGREMKLRGSSGLRSKRSDSDLPIALQSIAKEEMQLMDGLIWQPWQHVELGDLLEEFA